MTNDPDYLEDSVAFKLGMDVTEAMDREFHDSPDRVIAIVGAAYLDTLVEQLLRTAFVDDAKASDKLLDARSGGAVSGAAARIDLAYSLGLIEQRIRDDLRIVARARNLFAHRFDMTSLAHPDVVNLFRHVTYADKATKFDRNFFQNTVRGLFVLLLGRLHALVRLDKSRWYPTLPTST